jgi:hypothetical protein
VDFLFRHFAGVAQCLKEESCSVSGVQNKQACFDRNRPSRPGLGTFVRWVRSSLDRTVSVGSPHPVTAGKRAGYLIQQMSSWQMPTVQNPLPELPASLITPVAEARLQSLTKCLPASAIQRAG